MNDYTCPECGHDAYYHVEINTNPNYRACSEKDCLCQLPVHIMYRKLLASQAQALAEAREALKPFAHEDLCKVLGGNVYGEESIFFQRDKAILRLKDTNRAAEWLKKYP